MVIDLLTLARLEAGQSHREQHPGRVLDQVREVLDPYLPVVTEQELEVRLDIAPDLVATLDWPRIRHLVRNLFDNALQHTPAEEANGRCILGALRCPLRALGAQYSMQLTSTITCPNCAGKNSETMELNACRYLYTCPSCGEHLRPRAGDCCVFCSYGDVECPPRQTGDECCR